MFEEIQSLEEENKKLMQKLEAQKSRNQKLWNMFQSTEKKLKNLKEENEQLKAKIQVFENHNLPVSTYKENDIVLGFKIKKSKTTTISRNVSNDKKRSNHYYRYFATKRIFKKNHRIYIGSSLEKEMVKEKIKGYLKKNKIEVFLSEKTEYVFAKKES